MRILGIDTTRKIARLFAYDEGKEFFVNVDENIKHTEGVFLYLEKLLYQSKLKLNDFDYLSAVVGPGSFTGIRVGMSVIKGFNKSLNKKIVSINTFDIILKIVKNGVFLINSTSTSCYFAKIKSKQLIETGVVDKDKISSSFAGETIYILAEEQNIINIEYNNIVVIENICDNYFPAILQKIENNDIGEFLPYYLQLSQAERNIKND